MGRVKTLILDTCYNCPYSAVVWEEQDADEHFLRHGCQHKDIKMPDVKEPNGRLVMLAESMRERPEIPDWCPLEDSKLSSF